MSTTRRVFLVSLAAIPFAEATASEPARAAAEGVLRGRIAEEGGIEITAPRVAENGQQVPVTIRVTEGEPRAIHIIATANPTPGIATFHLHQGNVRPEVQTRIRLAEAQRVLVYADLADGRVRFAAVEIGVTTGGCLS